MTDKKTQGKKNRQAGARFELKVRKDLEKKGWIVARWNNNVDLDEHEGVPDFIGSKEVVTITPPHPKLINAKSTQYNRGTTGFPDFIAFMLVMIADTTVSSYEVIGVECKLNGYLTKEEKAKCGWLLDNNIFNNILIASKGKQKRGEIIYKEIQK